MFGTPVPRYYYLLNTQLVQDIIKKNMYTHRNEKRHKTLKKAYTHKTL